MIPVNLKGISANKNGNDYPYTIIHRKLYLMSHLVKLYYEDITIWDVDADGNFVACPGLERNRVDASHLCHKPYCINPHHIVFESASLNLSRNSCFMKFRCNGHGDNPSCIFFVTPIEVLPNPGSFKINKKVLKIIQKYRLTIAESCQAVNNTNQK